MILIFICFISKKPRKPINEQREFFPHITHIWRAPSISELTSIIFNTGLTHLGSEASIYKSLQDKIG